MSPERLARRLRAALPSAPASLVFGLPAALLAHLMAFGRQHLVGGDYHALFLQLALALATASAATFAALALGDARLTPSGSVLAARLRARAPSWTSLPVCAIGWFVALESAETAHDASILIESMALALSTLIVSVLVRRLVALVARVTFALVRDEQRSRKPMPCLARRGRRPFFLQPAVALQRRAIRPPP